MTANQNQFDELLSQLTDGKLTSEQEGQLFDMLRDEKAQSAYLDHVELHAMLRWVEAPPLDIVEDTADDAPEMVTLSESRQAAGRGRMFDWLADALPAGIDYRAHPGRFGLTVAGITLACWAMLIAFITPDQSTLLVAQPTTTVAPIVAQLTGALNAEWSQRTPRVGVGQMLRRGDRIELEQGFVEVTFADGALVVVEGPAHVQLSGRGTARLTYGALTAQVPQRAVGFRVETPAAQLVDLGTEFAVQVDRRGTTDVQVFEGRVRAELVQEPQLPDVPRERILLANQAARFDRQRRHVASIPFEIQRRRVLRAGRTYIAYQHRAGLPGVQTGAEMLGHDFIVHKPISITRLGAFDSDADGFPRLITVELWSRQDGGTPHDPSDDRPGEKLVSTVFNSDAPGELVDSTRFKPVPRPVVLAPGAYTVVAYGYGEGEPNGNSKYSPREPQYKSTDDGDGTLEFVGTARHGTHSRQPHTTFPLTVGDGPADRYRAGTFEFRVPGVHVQSGREAGTQ